MQPRFTSHNNEAKSSTTAKSIVLPEAWPIAADIDPLGSRGGRSFHEEEGTVCPLGYRFITIGR